MALWQHGDGAKESIVVRIETRDDLPTADGLLTTCDVEDHHERQAQPEPAPITIHVDSDSVALTVAGCEKRFGRTDPIRRNTLAAGDTVRGAMAFGLWSAAYGPAADRPIDLPRILLASAALATLKCYAGSFVDFLKMLEELRGTPAWRAIWAITT
jgi:hypothetical protein